MALNFNKLYLFLRCAKSIDSCSDNFCLWNNDAVGFPNIPNTERRKYEMDVVQHIGNWIGKQFCFLHWSVFSESNLVGFLSRVLALDCFFKWIYNYDRANTILMRKLQTYIWMNYSRYSLSTSSNHQSGQHCSSECQLSDFPVLLKL
jgi:hypothetical protein